MSLEGDSRIRILKRFSLPRDGTHHHGALSLRALAFVTSGTPLLHHWPWIMLELFLQRFYIRLTKSGVSYICRPYRFIEWVGGTFGKVVRQNNSLATKTLCLISNHVSNIRHRYLWKCAWRSDLRARLEAWCSKWNRQKESPLSRLCFGLLFLCSRGSICILRNQESNVLCVWVERFPSKFVTNGYYSHCYLFMIQVWWTRLRNSRRSSLISKSGCICPFWCTLIISNKQVLLHVGIFRLLNERACLHGGRNDCRSRLVRLVSTPLRLSCTIATPNCSFLFW